MALDTTVGGATTDSYASLAEAEAYHASRGFNAAWTAATVEDKERCLRWAARNIDAYVRFKGNRVDYRQKLAWPRWNVLTKDGFLVPSDEVPARVKEAQAEYAFQLLKEDWTQGLGPVVDKGVSVGPLHTTEEVHRPMPHSVSMLLNEFVLGGTGASRSVEMTRG